MIAGIIALLCAIAVIIILIGSFFNYAVTKIAADKKELYESPETTNKGVNSANR